MGFRTQGGRPQKRQRMGRATAQEQDSPKMLYSELICLLRQKHISHFSLDLANVLPQWDRASYEAVASRRFFAVYATKDPSSQSQVAAAFLSQHIAWREEVAAAASLLLCFIVQKHSSSSSNQGDMRREGLGFQGKSQQKAILLRLSLFPLN